MSCRDCKDDIAKLDQFNGYRTVPDRTITQTGMPVQLNNPDVAKTGETRSDPN